MEISQNFIPRLSASSFASVLLLLLVNLDGIDIPITLSFPSASTAIAAVRLESIPPDNPIATLLKLFFLT